MRSGYLPHVFGPSFGTRGEMTSAMPILPCHAGWKPQPKTNPKKTIGNIIHTQTWSLEFMSNQERCCSTRLIQIVQLTWLIWLDSDTRSCNMMEKLISISHGIGLRHWVICFKTLNGQERPSSGSQDQTRLITGSSRARSSPLSLMISTLGMRGLVMKVSTW